MNLTGFSIIAGAAASDRSTPFHAIDPATGRDSEVTSFAASPAEVAAAASSAADAFDAYRDTPPSTRAEFLERCAANIAALGDELLRHASMETGLAIPRLGGERDRTCNQFRFFAGLVREGSWVDAVIDHGDPSRTPLPKPDLRRMRVPLGPAAVFGASNFPLAYSAGGGDTASALAAGCPVVVKGHPSHPSTGELVAAAITRAAKDVSLPSGVYSYLHAGGAREIEVGRELITSLHIRAAGFTGSLRGGMALAQLASARPDPIPVFAEMGSANPVFILPGALEKDAAGLAARLHASVTNSTGQMCTCPGLIFLAPSPKADEFIHALAASIAATDAMVMLSPKIRSSYVARLGELAAVPGVREVRGGDHARPKTVGEHQTPRSAYGRPALLTVPLESFHAHHTLREECFGPSTLCVTVPAPTDLHAAAGLIDGSLTGTICFDSASTSDTALARAIQQVLERRVGRVIYNGVPTGVEVARAMVHGGPYPATNQPHTSAVGSLALERWCRPVCYQNCPDDLLPLALRDSNPLKLTRTTTPIPSRA